MEIIEPASLGIASTANFSQLEKEYHLIASNITNGDIESKINQASVILLLNYHNDVTNPNQQTIQNYWRAKDFLLTEGNPNDTLKTEGDNYIICQKANFNHFPAQIVKASRSWDVNEISVKEIEHLEKWQRLIRVAIALPTYLYLNAITTDQKLRENDKELQQLFADYDQKNWEKDWAKFVHLDKISRFKMLLSMAKNCIDLLNIAEKEDFQIVQHEFYRRNCSMVDKALAALASYERVWIEAGEAHGKYLSMREKDAVTHFYQTLESRNIPYVTLMYRREDEVSYCHTPVALEEQETIARSEHERYKTNFFRERENECPSTSLEEEYLWMINEISEWETFLEDKGMEVIFDYGLFCQFILKKTCNWTCRPNPFFDNDVTA